MPTAIAALPVPRCVGYTRVSTQTQATSGHGLDSQREKIEDECRRRNWPVEIRSEGGVSSGAPRVVFATLLQAMRRGDYDVLMVAKLDRMSRSLIEGAKVIQDAAREGWQLVVLDPMLDMSTSSGQLIANMMLSIAEFERALIRQRTRDGLEAARHKGVRLGRPSALDPGVVERVRQQRANGALLREIAADLTAAGVPTSRGLSVWSTSSVNYLLAQDSTA